MENRKTGMKSKKLVFKTLNPAEKLLVQFQKVQKPQSQKESQSVSSLS